jgi:hypothetical protein
MKIGPNPEQLLKDTPSAKRPDQDGDGMTVTVEKIVGKGNTLGKDRYYEWPKIFQQTY